MQKYTLLKESRKILVPGTQIRGLSNTGEIRTVYRMYYLKDVKNGEYSIPAETLGGFVEDESMCQEDNTIIRGNSVVLRGANLTDCVIEGDALIYGSPTLKQCLIKDSSIVGGTLYMYNSIVSDVTSTEGSVKIDSCEIIKNAKVKAAGRIFETTITGGSYIHGDVDIENSRIEGTANVLGRSVVRNSCLSGRAVVRDGRIINETISLDYTLNVTQGSVGE